MIDIALIRNNPDLIRETLKKRNSSPDIVEKLVDHDAKWRRAVQRLEALQAERNGLTKNQHSAREHRDRLVVLKKEISTAEQEAKLLQEELHRSLTTVPNILASDVPIGPDETANKVLKKNGTITQKKGLAHEELMSRLGWLDLDVPARVSGARFRYLRGSAAHAQRKLMNFAIDFATRRGFEFVLPPIVARAETLTATGFFPKGMEDTFQLDEDQYLVGTSEPMLLMLAAGKTFRPEELPLRMVGYSTCFRKEAGSYGRDVKGMFRVHQFDKVELVSICRPEDSAAEHELIVSMQEELVQHFALPYRKVLLSSGDQSHIAMKQIDIETWFPSQELYRETHSASNCGDYQARLMRTRVTTDNGVVLAHTLNGTLVTERLLLALVENNQDSATGEVKLPIDLA